MSTSQYCAVINYTSRTAKGGVSVPAPGYILDYYNGFYKSWYIGPNNFDNRIAHNTGLCNTGIISGSELNDFLYGEKEVIIN